MENETVLEESTIVEGDCAPETSSVENDATEKNSHNPFRVFRPNERYSTIAIYVVLTFAICAALGALIFYGTITSFLSLIVKVLSPVFTGILIAYFLNFIMVFFEKNAFGNECV